MPRRVELKNSSKRAADVAVEVDSDGSPQGGPTKLFVGGVSAHTTTEALRAHFSRYGRIIDAVVMQKNGRPRGFGFVTFDRLLPAELALAEPQWLDGRLVDVKRAVPAYLSQERFSNKIFVGGLPQDVSTEELRRYFGGYGTVSDAVVMVDRRTNRSRGFGFVRFRSGAQGNADSEAVLRDFNSHRLAGKWVEVKRATPASQLQEDELSDDSGLHSSTGSPTCLQGYDTCYEDYGFEASYRGAYTTAAASAAAAAAWGTALGACAAMSGPAAFEASATDDLAFPFADYPAAVLPGTYGNENDPGQANLNTNTRRYRRADSPMKVPCRHDDATLSSFTREDFLSLEVGGPSVPAW